MFLYSKEYRRTVESLVKSAKKIITLLLFFVIACAIFATIGVRFIGDLDGEIPFDKVKFFPPAISQLRMFSNYLVYEQFRPLGIRFQRAISPPYRRRLS